MWVVLLLFGVCGKETMNVDDFFELSVRVVREGLKGAEIDEMIVKKYMKMFLKGKHVRMKDFIEKQKVEEWVKTGEIVRYFKEKRNEDSGGVLYRAWEEGGGPIGMITKLAEWGVYYTKHIFKKYARQMKAKKKGRRRREDL